MSMGPSMNPVKPFSSFGPVYAEWDWNRIGFKIQALGQKASGQATLALLDSFLFLVISCRNGGFVRKSELRSLLFMSDEAYWIKDFILSSFMIFEKKKKKISFQMECSKAQRLELHWRSTNKNSWIVHWCPNSMEEFLWLHSSKFKERNNKIKAKQRQFYSTNFSIF